MSEETSALRPRDERVADVAHEDGCALAPLGGFFYDT